MSVLLVVVSLSYVGFLAVVELVCALTARPTISLRVQTWVHGNYQLAAIFLVLAGFLVAHFTQT